MTGTDPTGTDSAATRVERLLAAVALLAVAGTVVALVLVQRIGSTYRDGLEVTRDGAEVAAVGTSSARQLASDVAELARAASSGLDQAQRLVELAVESTGDVGVALGTNLAQSVEGTANIANGMAGLIEAIERLIPGDSQSLAEDLRALAEGLEPVPEQLRSLGDQLITTSGQLESSAASLQTISDQLAALATSIDDAQATLAEVDVLARDVALRAGKAFDRSELDLLLLRLLVLVMGIGLAVACIAARQAVRSMVTVRPRAGGGTRTHTPFGTET